MPSPYRRFKHIFFGRPLPSERLEHERLNKKTALAVLSSDAISSVAYATDQILFVVGGAIGMMAVNYVLPISAVIVGLLVASQSIFATETGFLHHLYLPNAKVVPHWVEIGAYTAISLGTLLGGWRIVQTMGQRITRLRPVGGFAAETAGALSILLPTYLGIPVSTTHTITGAIVGVGATHRLSAVRWGLAQRIVWAWIITIPAAAALSACAYFIVRAVAGGS